MNQKYSPSWLVQIGVWDTLNVPEKTPYFWIIRGIWPFDKANGHVRCSPRQSYFLSFLSVCLLLQKHQVLYCLPQLSFQSQHWAESTTSCSPNLGLLYFLSLLSFSFYSFVLLHFHSSLVHFIFRCTFGYRVWMRRDCLGVCLAHVPSKFFSYQHMNFECASLIYRMDLCQKVLFLELVKNSIWKRQLFHNSMNSA